MITDQELIKILKERIRIERKKKLFWRNQADQWKNNHNYQKKIKQKLSNTISEIYKSLNSIKEK